MSDITPAPTDAQSAEPHPYDVLGMLATGGMAEVYLGRRVSDGALIVLKRLRPCFARPAPRSRFSCSGWRVEPPSGFSATCFRTAV